MAPHVRRPNGPAARQPSGREAARRYERVKRAGKRVVLCQAAR